MQPIVIASVFGGIGNQLFCWATGFATARRLRARLVLDCRSYSQDAFGRTYMLPQLGIDAECIHSPSLLERATLPLFSHLAEIKKGFLRLPGIAYYADPGGALNHELLDAHTASRSYLRGYWQSADYFNEYDNEIRQSVTFQSCIRRRTPENSVCVHIRSFKEVSSQARNVLDRSFYESAYSRCRRRIGQPHFIVYTDDLAWAQNENLLPDSYELGWNHHTRSCPNHDLCDLITMSSFQNLIIANSTFSWWAAYLTNEGAWISAPSPERQCWYSEHPLPSFWERL